MHWERKFESELNRVLDNTRTDKKTHRKQSNWNEHRITQGNRLHVLD